MGTLHRRIVIPGKAEKATFFCLQNVCTIFGVCNLTKTQYLV